MKKYIIFYLITCGFSASAAEANFNECIKQKEAFFVENKLIFKGQIEQVKVDDEIIFCGLIGKNFNAKTGDFKEEYNAYYMVIKNNTEFTNKAQVTKENFETVKNITKKTDSKIIIIGNKL